VVPQSSPTRLTSHSLTLPAMLYAPYGLIANGKLSTGAVSFPERLGRTPPNVFASYWPHGIRMPNRDTRPSRDAFSHSKSDGRRPPRQAQDAEASCPRPPG